MSNHFFGIARGLDGMKISDFVFGNSSNAASDIELRVADVDGQSKPLKRVDVVKALQAFERVMNSGRIFTTFPPL